MTEFFMAMIPPTSTKQARGWHQAADGKVISYDRANANAEGKLTAHLAKHIPQKPYTGAIRVLVKWLFPLRGSTGTANGTRTSPMPTTSAKPSTTS